MKKLKDKFEKNLPIITLVISGIIGCLVVFVPVGLVLHDTYDSWHTETVSTSSTPEVSEDIIESSSPEITYSPSPSETDSVSTSAPNTTSFESMSIDDLLSDTYVVANEAALRKPKSLDRLHTLTDKNRKAFYDLLKRLYLSGIWDGSLSAIAGHTIELSSHGEILTDGYLLDSQKCLDLPDPFTDGTICSYNLQFIPGQGTYVIIGNTYSKYLRGEKIELPGEPIIWEVGEGIDTEYGHPIIFYDNVYDKMFMWAPRIIDYFIDTEPEPIYFYIFPDYNVSKVEFIGRVVDFEFDNEGFKYLDPQGISWRYFEEDGQYSFKKGY